MSWLDFMINDLLKPLIPLDMTMLITMPSEYLHLLIRYKQPI